MYLSSVICNVSHLSEEMKDMQKKNKYILKKFEKNVPFRKIYMKGNCMKNFLLSQQKQEYSYNLYFICAHMEH